MPYTFEQTLGFPKEQVAECVRLYREYFAEKGLFENVVYDGIEDLLASLNDEGRCLYVATSKPEEYSIRILEKFGLAKYFRKICGSCMDESRSKKSEVIKYALECAGNPSLNQVLMIGDRSYDIEGAKQNGIPSLGVLFGYGNRPELENAGADYIAETVEDLKRILVGIV